LVAVYFLLSSIELRRIPEVLSRIPIPTLVIGFLMYLFFVLLKTLRFQSILNITLSLKRFFPIIALHTFWTNLLPMRTGDISYIYLLKSREQVSGTKSVASLMVVSVLDILLQLMLIVGIAWYFKSRLASKISYTTFLLIPFLGILALLSIVSVSLILPKRCVAMAEGIALTFQRLNGKRARGQNGKRVNYCCHFRRNPEGFWGIPSELAVLPSCRLAWLGDKLAQLSRELTDISVNMRLLGIFAYSVVILGVRFGMQCYLVKAMGLNLGVLEILFALAFTAFCNMFPIQSVASLGTIELPWAWALISLSAPKDAAIASGFSLHIIIILYSVVLGLSGVITAKFPKSSRLRKSKLQ